MNNDVKKEKLEVKDLILIGVMAILLYACMFVVVLILGMNPVTYLFAPAISGIPAGTVYTCGLTLVAFISVVLLKDAFAEAFAMYGESYISKIIELVTPLSLAGLCLLSAFCGIIGAYIGKILLKKHFEKAGVL